MNLEHLIETQHATLNRTEDGLHSVLEPTEGFDYEEVFERLDGEISPDKSQAMAADALAELFAFIWKSSDGQRHYSSVINRLIVVTAAVWPDLVNRQTLRQLADELSCTRALLSKYSVEFREQFGGVNFRGQRTAAQRERMRQARLKAVKRQREEAAKKAGSNA